MMKSRPFVLRCCQVGPFTGGQPSLAKLQWPRRRLPAHAPVLRARPDAVALSATGSAFAKTLRRGIGCRHTVLDEEIVHGIGAVLAQLKVIVIAADGVRIALHLHLEPRIDLKNGGQSSPA